MGDMEDNQPDSSAPEDEQTDHTPQQPIGVYDNNNDSNKEFSLLLLCLEFSLLLLCLDVLYKIYLA